MEWEDSPRGSATPPGKAANRPRKGADKGTSSQLSSSTPHENRWSISGAIAACLQARDAARNYGPGERASGTVVPTDSIPAAIRSVLDATYGTTSEFHIELPSPGQLRARKLIGRSRRIMTGKYPSWKMGQMLHWESRQEAAVFRLLDACPAISRFAEQPFTIHYFDGICWRSHVPDLLVQTCFGDYWILEIKSRWDRHLADAATRASRLAPMLSAYGCKYAVIDEAALCQGKSIDVARQLIRHGRHMPTSKAHDEFVRILSSKGALSKEHMAGLVIDGRYGMDIGANLVLHGYVSTNWSDLQAGKVIYQPLSGSNTQEALEWLLHALGATKRLS